MRNKSDASNVGWGAVRGTLTTQHINILELQAAFFALKFLCAQESNLHIQIQLDKSTAVAFINNMGSTKSPKLNTLAVEIWKYCIKHTIWLSAMNITGNTNTEADKSSWKLCDKHVRMLNKMQFQIIATKYPEIKINFLACRLNA